MAFEKLIRGKSRAEPDDLLQVGKNARYALMRAYVLHSRLAWRIEVAQRAQNARRHQN